MGHQRLSRWCRDGPRSRPISFLTCLRLCRPTGTCRRSPRSRPDPWPSGGFSPRLAHRPTPLRQRPFVAGRHGSVTQGGVIGVIVVYTSMTCVRSLRSWPMRPTGAIQARATSSSGGVGRSSFRREPDPATMSSPTRASRAPAPGNSHTWSARGGTSTRESMRSRTKDHATCQARFWPTPTQISNC
jgi:hypothetical protein